MHGPINIRISISVLTFTVAHYYTSLFLSTFFSDHDAANVLITACRPGIYQRLRRTYASLFNSNGVFEVLTLDVVRCCHTHFTYQFAVIILVNNVFFSTYSYRSLYYISVPHLYWRRCLSVFQFRVVNLQMALQISG